MVPEKTTPDDPYEEETAWFDTKLFIMDWKIWLLVLFSDESHFFIQGQRSRYVRKSSNESISPKHINEQWNILKKKDVLGMF